MSVENYDWDSELSPAQARKLLSYVLVNGTVTFSGHAKRELAADGCTEVDARNVLKGGRIHEPAELVKGSWRYRVHTPKMCVVVAFDNLTHTIVVTAWVKKGMN